MIDLKIIGGCIVTVNKKREIIHDGAIVINEGRIIDVGKSRFIQEKYPESKKTINAQGKAVFPGLINTHTHLFQSLLKGLGDDRVLSDWLVQVMFPSAAKLTPEEAYYGAMLGCLEGLRSGTTTILDYMHAHPRSGLSDAVIRAYKATGIRGILARGYMDNGLEFGTPRALMEDTASIAKDCRRLIEKYHNSNDGKIKVWIAPAAVWLSSKESLLMTKRLAEEYNVGITVHVSETPFDREATRQLHGDWDTDVLERLGMLGPNILMVHCVHLTPRDIRMFKYFDAKVSHNPVSNMYLSSGVAPIPQLLECGVKVGVATDGAASNNSNDMLEVLKFTALLHKVYHKDPTIITAEKVLEMATIDGARAIGLEDEIGSLEAGKKADLFIFDPKSSVKAVPMHHPVSTLVYSSSSGNVETVIVNGDIILENGQVLNSKEDEILKKAQNVADELSKKAGTYIYRSRPWRSLAY